MDEECLNYINISLEIFQHGNNLSLLAFVHTDPEVTGWKEHPVRLKCESSQVPYAVYWGKVNESNPEETVKQAHFFNNEPKSFANRFSMDDDFALVIQDVHVADEGRYSCQVVTKNTDDSKNFTKLIVYGKLLDLLWHHHYINIPLSLMLNYFPWQIF